MALTKEQFIADFKDMALKMYAAPLEDLSSQQLYQALALLTRTYIANLGLTPRSGMIKKRPNRFITFQSSFYLVGCCSLIC